MTYNSAHEAAVALRRRIDTLLDTAERLEAKAAALEAIGDDDHEDGSVLVWARRFLPGGTLYTYAALRAGGLWSVTGKETDRLDWPRLVDEHLAHADGIVWRATVLEPATDVDELRPAGRRR